MKLDENIWSKLIAKAETGDSDSQNDLAIYFEFGYDANEFYIERNIEKAAYWYLKSAESGNRDSQDAISRLYSLGLGIEKNLEKAIEWALISIDQGNEIAAYNLGTLYRDQSKFEKAFEYYSISLKMGNESAILQLALCYYFGIGVSIDYKRATALFEQVLGAEFVASCEVDQANYWLGFSCLNGNGQIRSVNKARAYFYRADIDGDHEPSQLMLNLIGRNIDSENRN